MSTAHMRHVYVGHLVREHAGVWDGEQDRWTVTRDGVQLDVTLLDDGFPSRVRIAGLVITQSASTAQTINELCHQLPFGRLTLRDGDVWLSHTIHADDLEPEAFARSLSFVRWALGAVADELGLTQPPAQQRPTGAPREDAEPTAPTSAPTTRIPITTTAAGYL